MRNIKINYSDEIQSTAMFIGLNTNLDQLEREINLSMDSEEWAKIASEWAKIPISAEMFVGVCKTNKIATKKIDGKYYFAMELVDSEYKNVTENQTALEFWRKNLMRIFNRKNY